MRAGQDGGADGASDRAPREHERRPRKAIPKEREGSAKTAALARPGRQRHLEPAASLPPLPSAAVQDIDHVTRWRLEPRHRGLPTRGASPARKGLLGSYAPPAAGVGIARPERTKFPGFSALFCRRIESRVVGARLDDVQDGGHKLITSREAEKEVAAEPASADGNASLEDLAGSFMMFPFEVIINQVV